MSTNSTISVVTPEGVFTVYNHWDGYPEYMMPMLQNNYQDMQQALELVKNGDISILKERCDGAKGHTFDTPVDKQTIFYGRDRGESGTDPVITPLEEFKKQGSEVSTYGRQQYNYVYANGQWMMESEFLAEEEDNLIENLVDQIHEDLKSDETAAVYEMIELLYTMNNPDVDKILKNYLPQS